MPNRRIASRISEFVAACERGQVSTSALAKSPELHAPAFEAIPSSMSLPLRNSGPFFHRMRMFIASFASRPTKASKS